MVGFGSGLREASHWSTKNPQSKQAAYRTHTRDSAHATQPHLYKGSKKNSNAIPKRTWISLS